MIQEKIYKKSIDRPLNPAVSVGDNRQNTIDVEIGEYVFTAEIINGLYTLLSAVRDKSVSHNGIWISGYYGSGKSHFLKYLNFCIDKRYQEKALARLEEAVAEFDPLQHSESKSQVEISDIRDLAIWLKSAKIDSILFNIGAKVDGNKGDRSTFAKALWEEFNTFRGFNKFNIALAQYLERPLAEHGKLDAFKLALEAKGYDWEDDAQTLAVTALGKLIDIAKSVEPNLSYDVIYENIKRNAVTLTPETFCAEIRHYLADKGDSYRLLFFVDEVSQFIGDRKELLLQLQEIVSGLSQASDGRVWVGCTAQQDLSELLSTHQILQSADEYGKIMGRFEKKVTLQGTNTEYITQKRILDKDEDAVVSLGKLYEEKKDAISAQFKLPTGYKSYTDKREFIDYYPFIPYQFPLIMQVFDAFVKLQYVDTEVKGNERSVLKITHKTAQESKEEEVGKFISFDKFFSSMFEAGLKNAGLKAIHNANTIVETYKDKAFGMRVTRVLFMLCNLSAPDQKIFPATVDNIVTLLMTNVDENKLQLRNNTEDVLKYLEEKSVVRVEHNPGSPDVYFFLSEDESEVDRIIKGTKVDNNRMAEELRTIFFRHLGNPAPKVLYNGNNFSVSWTIQGRICLGTNNAQLPVEFLIDRDGRTPEEIAFQNDRKKLLFLVNQEYAHDNRLRDEFFWFCQVQEYISHGATSEQRAKTNEEFKKRAAELYDKSILPGFKKLLDKVPVVIGQSLLPAGALGTKTGSERYNEALRQHFEQLYSSSKLVAGSVIPKTPDELKSKIRRAIQPNEYAISPLSPAEEAVENKLSWKGHDYTLADLIADFQAVPYGWNEVATIYIVNELVRRHLRAYKYKGDPNVDRNRVAETIIKERTSYEITSAQKIDPALIDEFLTSWKDIFGQVGSNYSHDSSELFHQCREDNDSPINKIASNYRVYASELSKCSAFTLAQVLEDAIALMSDKWHAEHDPEKFFKMIIADRQLGKDTMDKCKKVVDFHHNQKDLYKQIVDFVKDNEDNFTYLPEDCADDISFIKSILTDVWPVDTMPSYKKRMNILTMKINETRSALKEEIEQGFAKVYEELNQFAADNGVPNTILPSLNSQVVTKTASSVISTLKLNLTTIGSFRESMLNKILDEKARIAEAKAKAAAASADTQSGDAAQQPKPKTIRKISSRVVFKTPQTISSDADIDSYLSSVRQKIKEQLSGNDELVIL
jgi:predicted DNA-binding protein (UPF0278 family)